MGSNKNNRFSTLDDVNKYLTSINRHTLECIKYGGTFKADSDFKCKIDGYTWTSNLNSIKNARSTGCPCCGNVARITNIDSINQYLKNSGKNIKCIYYDGTAASSFSKFKCLIDEYEWTAKLSNIKSGKGCPVCAKVKKIKDIKEVNQWLSENNRDMVCINYCGNLRELSEFQCNICNKTWKSTFNNIKNGNSCPHCSASKGERRIAKILDKNSIKYIYQYWFDDCRITLPLPFDFALFSNDKLICLCEYQGEQHYKPVDFANRGIEWAEKQFKRNQFSDSVKCTYCKENNIPLLEIPYWDYDHAENIILKFLKKVT